MVTRPPLADPPLVGPRIIRPRRDVVGPRTIRPRRDVVGPRTIPAMPRRALAWPDPRDEQGHSYPQGRWRWTGVPGFDGGMAVYTTSQLHDSGRNDRLIRREVEIGGLTRLRHGCYAPGEPVSPEQRHRLLIEATRGRLGSTTVVSHLSAAVLHGWPVPAALLGPVTGTRMRVTAGGGDVSAWLHTYAGSLEASEIVEIAGVRVTSPARTAADAARLLPRNDAVVMLDAALHLTRRAEDRDLRLAIAARLAIDARRRGARAAEAALRLSDGLAESPAESSSRLTFLDHGIPAPVLQFEVVDRFGRVVAITDFAWPEFGVVGEVDGRTKYESLLRPGESATDVIVREKRRENDIQALGWLVFRWMPSDLATPAGLSGRLRRMLEMGVPHLA